MRGEYGAAVNHSRRVYRSAQWTAVTTAANPALERGKASAIAADSALVALIAVITGSGPFVRRSPGGHRPADASQRGPAQFQAAEIGRREVMPGKGEVAGTRARTVQ